MPITRRRVTSAADMKALAHPVRLDVLELLIVNGPMTASDAAVQLDQTPANVSWHLRKLAEHGFVRQATSGPGRRRSVEGGGRVAVLERRRRGRGLGVGFA